jgi:hypothetical protein
MQGPRDGNSGAYGLIYAHIRVLCPATQPFLTPVSTVGSDAVPVILIPVKYLAGIFRTAVVLLLAAVHLVLVNGLCLIFVSALLLDFSHDSN